MPDANGCRTLREILADVTADLETQGIQEPSGGFRVLFAGGETVLIASDSNPHLDRTDQVAKVTPVSTAKAGA